MPAGCPLRHGAEAPRHLLLRLAAFAARHSGRLQKTERCATHSSLFLPLAAVAVRAPTGGGKSTPVGGGQEVVRQTCSQLCLTVQFTIIDARTLGSPRGGAGETPVRAARLRGEPPTRAGEVPPQAAERASALFAPLSGASSLPLYAVTKKVTEKARRGTPCGRYG